MLGDLFLPIHIPSQSPFEYGSLSASLPTYLPAEYPIDIRSITAIPQISIQMEINS